MLSVGEMYYSDVQTGLLPHTWLRLIAQADGALWWVGFAGQKYAPALPELVRNDALLGDARDQFVAYFNGERTRFDVMLAARGTEFQQRVWSALREIPYGHTITYAEIAARIGRPNAVRAVGAANGRNPWSIVVPCHRVIGRDGQLTGYAAGVDIKRAILELEARRVPRSGTQQPLL